MVIDSGFSQTYVVPCFEGIPMRHCATRIDVGGKLLSNLLMETLSFKEINLKNEVAIVNQIKESCTFISDRFAQDLEVCKAGGMIKEFVLPDYKTIKRGYVRDPLPEGGQ